MKQWFELISSRYRISTILANITESTDYSTKKMRKELGYNINGKWNLMIFDYDDAGISLYKFQQAIVNQRSWM